MKAVRALFALSVVLFAGCSSFDDAGDTSSSITVTTVQDVRTSVPASSPRPAMRFTPAKDISAYKGQVARHIVNGHAQTFSGELPPILKSIVVLDLTVDRDGRATRVTVMRSNGFKQLEQVALDSVKRVGAFPAPTKAVLNGSSNVRYLETWLFRDDGKFQIRSLVTMPQPGAEKLASADQATTTTQK